MTIDRPKFGDVVFRDVISDSESSESSGSSDQVALAASADDAYRRGLELGSAGSTDALAAFRRSADGWRTSDRTPVETGPAAWFNLGNAELASGADSARPSSAYRRAERLDSHR